MTLTINCKDAWELIKSGVTLIDVRTAGEFGQGHLSGAINIPHDQIAARIDELELKSDDEVVLYCKSGGRSDFAMKHLHSVGFHKAVNAGGYEDLKAAEN